MYVWCGRAQILGQCSWGPRSILGILVERMKCELGKEKERMGRKGERGREKERIIVNRELFKVLGLWKCTGLRQGTTM